MSVTEQELGSVPGKVSGRRAGEGPGMQAQPTHPIGPGVDLAELDRQIAEMYREVANDAARGLHFPTGRTLAEALGYPAELLDRLPAEAVRSFAGVGYHFGLARLLPGERVLDLGSGSGMDAFAAAAQVGSRGRVTGVDITPEQLLKAESLAQAEHVSFRRARIEELPFDDGSFDVVISNGVINLSADKRRVFAEAARVLRPGGRLAFADIVTERRIAARTACQAELWQPASPEPASETSIWRTSPPPDSSCNLSSPTPATASRASGLSERARNTARTASRSWRPNPYVLPATPPAPIWVMAPMSRERLRRRVPPRPHHINRKDPHMSPYLYRRLTKAKLARLRRQEVSK